MKLRSIALSNVRRFTRPVRLDGIGDGVNLLCEPNEHGKSTLFDALQAVFLKPFGSSDREIKALRPHAGGAPEVSVTLETSDGLFVVSKRWLSRPMAEVHRAGTLIAQADAAEDWIATQTGQGQSGPSGLVWVRQGQTGLTGGSKKEQEAATAARRDLMSSAVATEVEAMTGGRRMDRAMRRCAEELSALSTATGRPARHGPWDVAVRQVDELEAEHRDLTALAAELRDALIARKADRRTLSEIEAPEAVADRKARLDQARAAFETASRHAETEAQAALQLEEATLAKQAASERRQTAIRARTEQREALALVAESGSAAKAARIATEAAQQAFDASDIARKSARTDRDRADQIYRAAQRQHAARDTASRRAELTRRIARSEAARTEMETAAASLRAEIDDKALASLERHSAALTQATALRDAAATRLEIRYQTEAPGRISVEGATLPEGDRAILAPTRLDIPGVGSVTIRPARGAGDGAAVDRAEQVLRDALDAFGMEDLAAARASAERGADARRTAQEARALFQMLAPDGVDALRTDLSALPKAEDDAEPLDLEAAETALKYAETAMATAQTQHDTASARLSDAKATSARIDGAAHAAQDRLARAKAAAEALPDTDDTALARTEQQADDRFNRAKAQLEALRARAPDLDAAKAALTRAESVSARAADEINRLRPQIARLDERIARASGDGVEDRLAATAQSLDAARATLARYEHEVAMLRRLQRALETARDDARDRYFKPVAEELTPLLRLLWPEAHLTWDTDKLLPVSLTRNDQDEPIDILSGGTQEQIALMVRLAFARMLARSGRHAPVILDDALVYTDDDRIERMFDALHRQASDLQILVLTCRQRAFRDLGGTALRLLPVEEDA